MVREGKGREKLERDRPISACRTVPATSFIDDEPVNGCMWDFETHMPEDTGDPWSYFQQASWHPNLIQFPCSSSHSCSQIYAISSTGVTSSPTFESILPLYPKHQT
ncbi:hypothetical protein PIB30_008859 [Stylosanthes scabra]|uniref:Uncharacterized protein n=1 Tax=Stylosanthes scabra TaxID=79078 RepID=A0ABU6Z2T7_9FABA|nr:hypothetical protein [Stylosanthes scabra]